MASGRISGAEDRAVLGRGDVHTVQSGALEARLAFRTGLEPRYRSGLNAAPGR
jgi:hypothetical protein